MLLLLLMYFNWRQFVAQERKINFNNHCQLKIKSLLSFKEVISLVLYEIRKKKKWKNKIMEKHDVWEFQLDFLSINQSVALQSQRKQKERKHCNGYIVTFHNIMVIKKKPERKLRPLLKHYVVQYFHQQSDYLIVLFLYAFMMKL